MLMPPTLNIGVPGGNTAAQALSAGGAEHLGGKQLQRVGAGGERGEALATAWRRPVSNTVRATSSGCTTSASKLGESASLAPASAARSASSARSTVPAPIVACAAVRVRERLDAVERLRRIERHLDDPDAAVEQRATDGERLVRRDSPQDRDHAVHRAASHQGPPRSAPRATGRASCCLRVRASTRARRAAAPSRIGAQIVVAEQRQRSRFSPQRRAADLHADQNAGEVVGQRVGRSAIHQAGRAGGEEHVGRSRVLVAARDERRRRTRRVARRRSCIRRPRMPCWVSRP